MVNEELKTRERLALATLKANAQIQLKKIRAGTLSRNKRISQLNEELKTRERLALATLKTNEEIQLKRISAETLGTLSRNERISQLKNFQIGQQLNSEQSFLSELFGGGQRCMMPSKETLPPATINHSLMPNFGGIEEDDGYTTANNFGMGKFKGQTGSMFGI